MAEGMVLQVPAGWVGSAEETWTEPSLERLRATLVFSQAPATGLPLDERLTARLTEMEATLPGLDLEERRECRALAPGQQVGQLVARWRHREGEVSQIVTTFERHGIAYTLTSTVPVARIRALDPLVSLAFQALRLDHTGQVRFAPPLPWTRSSLTQSRAPGIPDGPSVALQREDGAPRSAVRLETEIRKLARVLPAFELMTSRKLTWEGAPALAASYRWAPPDAAPLQQQAMIFGHGNATWTFTATATREAFPHVRPMFDAIVASIRPST